MARPSLTQIERKWDLYREAAANVRLARAQAVSGQSLAEKTAAADEDYAAYRALVDGTYAVLPQPTQH